MYRGAYVAEKLARVAVDAGLDTSLLGALKQVGKAATFGIAYKQVVVVNACTGILLRLIPTVYGSQLPNRKHLVDEALERLLGIAASTSVMSSAGLLPQDFAWQSALTKPIDGLPEALGGALSLCEETADGTERRARRYEFVELLEKVNRELHSVAEQLRSADSFVVGAIGRTLFQLNRLTCELLKGQGFGDMRQQVEKCLRWNIHLPPFFPHHAARFDGGSQGFVELVESVAKTGILCALQGESSEIVAECVASIHFMADDCLEKTSSKYGFDEPRTLARACYLGVLALKRGWLDIFNDVRAKIKEFEPRYFAKYLTHVPEGIDPRRHNVMGLPHHDQLLRELLRFRRDLRERRFMRAVANAESMMASVVDATDVDRFLHEVWGVRLPGSRVEAELEAARVRLLEALQDSPACGSGLAPTFPGSTPRTESRARMKPWG